MVSGGRIFRSGLLMNPVLRMRITAFIAAALILRTGVLSAQDAQTEAPAVTVQTPGTPVLETGVPWTITLIVDCDSPDEVTVIPPSFSFFFMLERFLKTPRLTETDIQTVIEYRFIPSREGSFELGPFTVITPEGTARTKAHFLTVRPSARRQKILTPAVSWETSQRAVPRQMTAGDRLDLILRVTGMDRGALNPADSLLPPEFFMPEVPPGAILVSSPLTPQERAGGITLKLTLIPLEGDFYIPARTLETENARFEIPALRIQVNQPLPQSAAVQENPPETETAYHSDADDDLKRFLEGRENAPKRRFLLILAISLFFLVIIAALVCSVFIKGSKTNRSKEHEFWGNS